MPVIDGIIFLDSYELPTTGVANVVANPATATVDEASSLTINISGSNITNGTYYWRADSKENDFTQFAGSFEIVNNSGSFTITPRADSTTEGSESISISIRSGSTTGTVLTSATFTINDTSLNPPVYILTAASSNVDEGNAITFNVTGGNIINGTYYWAIDTNTADTYDAKSGTLTITSNAGSFNVTPSADDTPEGATPFTVALRTGSITGPIVATSNSVIINDTSKGRYGSIKFTKGNSPYLYITNNNPTDFAQRQFTTEFWVLFPNPTLYSDSGTLFPIAMAETGYWGLSFSAGQGQIAKSANTGFNQGYVFMSTSGIGANTVAGYTSPTVNNVWNHYALVGDGANIKLYVNGTLSQFVSNATTLASTPSLNPFQIHTSGNDVYQRINNGSSPECYIADYRHVKNTVYTGNFTRPTSWLSLGGNATIYPSTANVNTTFASANTVLLLQTHGPATGAASYKRFWDSSANAKTVTQALYYLNPPTDYNVTDLSGVSSPRPF